MTDATRSDPSCHCNHEGNFYEHTWENENMAGNAPKSFLTSLIYGCDDENVDVRLRELIVEHHRSVQT